MTVKFVVTRDEVRERYSLEDRQDINDKLDSGLKSAHLFFQGSLGTEWEEVSNQTDVFFLNRELFPVNPNASFRFRLKRGFVRSSPAPVIKYAVRRRDLTDVTQYTTLDATYYTVDYEKGIVFLDDDFLDIQGAAVDQWSGETGNRFFAITYSAGFDNEVVSVQGNPDGTPATVIPATNPAPDWLKEAILAWMASVLAMASNADNPSMAISASEKIQNAAADMIAYKKREIGFAFSPSS